MEEEITTFKPIQRKLLVLPDSEEVVTKGGIILAGVDSHTKLKQHVRARVVAVSKELADQIQEGDYVHYKKMYELSYDLNNVRHVILKEEHIDLIEKQDV